MSVRFSSELRNWHPLIQTGMIIRLPTSTGEKASTDGSGGEPWPEVRSRRLRVAAAGVPRGVAVHRCCVFSTKDVA